MLQGTAGVRRRSFRRRAATGLLAAVVSLAVALSAVVVRAGSSQVDGAVLARSSPSLVSPTATATAPPPPRHQPRDPAEVVAATGAIRLARAGLAAGDIPPAAWVAYLGAATVLAKAAPRCGLDWTVLAAIGLIESDHGRSTSASGNARERRAAPDTDGGRLDGSADGDLPVGPMRLLPSTWTVIGVDGDGDGVRSPSDIDDAALAVGVALCAGDARLGTTAGLRRALLRFAPSRDYVDLVIRVARAYADGGLGVPTATVTAIAYPVVTGTRETLARPSLARRVREAQQVAATSVGSGSSPSAQAPAAALASGGSAPTASGPTLTTSVTGTGPAATGTSDAIPHSGAPAPSAPTSGTTDSGTTAADPAATDPAPTDPAPTDAASDPATTDAASDPATTDPAPTDAASADPASADPAPTDAAAPDPAQGSPADGAAATATCPTSGTPPTGNGAPSSAPSADPGRDQGSDQGSETGAGPTTDPAADPPDRSDPTAQPAPCDEPTPQATTTGSAAVPADVPADPRAAGQSEADPPVSPPSP